MSPLRVFRGLAVTEAVTWVLLLAGMFLKYVTDTTEVGVQVAGPVHGVAFIAYCLTTLLVAVDQRWSAGRTVLGLASAVPPLMTVWFDRRVERQHGLGDRWRLRTSDPVSVPERLAAALVRRPGRGVAVGLAAVGVLTATALVAGPPVG